MDREPPTRPVASRRLIGAATAALLASLFASLLAGCTPDPAGSTGADSPAGPVTAGGSGRPGPSGDATGGPAGGTGRTAGGSVGPSDATAAGSNPAGERGGLPSAAGGTSSASAGAGTSSAGAAGGEPSGALRPVRLDAAALGVPIEAEIPTAWLDGTSRGRAYVHAPAATGRPAFAATLVVSSEPAPRGRTLAELVPDFAAEVAQEPAWKPTTKAGRAVAVGGIEGHEIAGEMLMDNSPLAVTRTMAIVPAPAGARLILVTGMSAPGDTAARETLKAIVESIAFP